MLRGRLNRCLRWDTKTSSGGTAYRLSLHAPAWNSEPRRGTSLCSYADHGSPCRLVAVLAIFGGLKCGLCVGKMWTSVDMTLEIWNPVDFMTKIVDSKRHALNRLRSLRTEKPITRTGRSVGAWPDIASAP